MSEYYAPNNGRLWRRAKRSDRSEGAASEVRHIDPAGYIPPPFKQADLNRTPNRQRKTRSAERSKRHKAGRKYNTPHDLAIKAANWAMKEDPECVKAHRRWLGAKKDLAIAQRGEIAAARAAYEAANAEWNKLTMQVFDRVIAERGFPRTGGAATAGKECTR